MRSLGAISTAYALAGATILIFASWACALGRQGMEPLEEKESHRLATIRRYGLMGGPNVVTDLLRALSDPSLRPRGRIAVMHALALHPEMRSISAIEAVLHAGRPGEDVTYARVARARILAELAAKDLPAAGERARVFLAEFLRESGLTASGIDARVRQPRERVSHPKTPVETYALWAIADRIYQNRDGALSSRSSVSGLDFGAVPATFHRSRLCMQSDDARVGAIIAELGGKSALRDGDFYLIQLAIDTGEIARDQVVLKLSAMDRQNPRPTYTAFSAMFDILKGIGDIETEPVLRKYLSDPDGRIVHYARIAHNTVKKGLRATYRIGY